MPARKGPKKVNRYSIEMKRTAVRLSSAPGARVMDVAEALDIHPFMLSRWRKLAREGQLVAAPAKKRKATSTTKSRPAGWRKTSNGMRSVVQTISAALCLALAGAVQATQRDATDALLRVLAQDRRAAVQRPLGTYPRVTRDVQPLVGVSQATIFGHMGRPDSCPWPTLEQCQRMPVWIYSFWPMQKDTSKGAGWSLILDTKDQRVWRTYWIAE